MLLFTCKYIWEGRKVQSPNLSWAQKSPRPAHPLFLGNSRDQLLVVWGPLWKSCWLLPFSPTCVPHLVFMPPHHTPTPQTNQIETKLIFFFLSFDLMANQTYCFILQSKSQSWARVTKEGYYQTAWMMERKDFMVTDGFLQNWFIYKHTSEILCIQFQTIAIKKILQ